MTPWTEFTAENVELIPVDAIGVFQLARGEGNIAYVGGAETSIREGVRGFLGKGYTHFQWVKLPWSKEVYEMSCRLFHHAGGRKRLDNLDHPYPPEGKFWICPMSVKSPANCEL